MTSLEFFELVLTNSGLFLSSMALMVLLLYFSVRKVAPAGYLDALHFYWTFTFGTAYGVVLALYVLGFVADYLFLIIITYGLMFLFAFSFFYRQKFSFVGRIVRLFTLPNSVDGKIEYKIIFVLYIILTLAMIFVVGFGALAEENRFEQNRGVGAYVRIIDAFRLFVISYLTLKLVQRYQLKPRLTFSLVGGLLFIMLLVFLSSFVNGSKFAMLEAIYAIILSMVVYGVRIKLSLISVSILFLFIAGFASIVLSINMDKAGIDKTEALFIPGTPPVLERLGLRIFGNSDKYYLSLPKAIIEDVEVGGVVERFVSPIIGSSRVSELLGSESNYFSLGKQILLYWTPDRVVAGGPTSHFDLFAYKYFGYLFGFLWVIFTGFILASLARLCEKNINNIFYASIVSVLWIRALPILLEPPVGLAYILDVLFLFLCVKIIGLLLRINSPKLK